jgi:hypothetical protein
MNVGFFDIVGAASLDGITLGLRETDSNSRLIGKSKGAKEF